MSKGKTAKSHMPVGRCMYGDAPKMGNAPAKKDDHFGQAKPAPKNTSEKGK
jgi:hypothetical protein